MVEKNQWIREKAIRTGYVEEVPYYVVPYPGGDSLNGYVIFKERPVKELGCRGILTYVPVHGGITYVEHDKHGAAYGFDTGHCDSHEYSRTDWKWIRSQCKVMVRGIRLAADLEDDYLSAEGDNAARAEICQKLIDLAPDQRHNFGTMINLLAGRL